MATRLSPMRIDEDTDELVSHAAHFLGRSKKSIVDDAVKEYVDNHRDEINARVLDALARIDDSLTKSVAVSTGLSAERIDELGGIRE